MRLLAIIDSVKIDETPFLVCVLYNHKGHRLDEVINPYEGSAEQAIMVLNQALVLHDFHSAIDVWTSDKYLFTELLKHPGYAVEIKHRDDTVDAIYTLKKYESVLRDSYEIRPLLPRWKSGLILFLQKLIIKLKGENAQ